MYIYIKGKPLPRQKWRKTTGKSFLFILYFYFLVGFSKLFLYFDVAFGKAYTVAALEKISR